MIHANQAVERAGSVAGVVIANHRGPRDRARELAIQHAEDVLLMAAGEGDAGEGVVVFVVGVTAKFFFKRMVRIRYPEVELIGEAEGFAFKSSSVLYGESALTITTE